MYTIFINDVAIYLAETSKTKLDVPHVNFLEINLDEVLRNIDENNQESLIIYHYDLQELWSVFCSKFKIIRAAGGLVFNEKNETLWIVRHDYWDLPKGKLEKNEKIEDGAIREVEEECAIKNLELKEFLMNTYHVYELKEKKILKISTWYKMVADSINQELKPQLEEGITKVAWLKVNEIEDVKKNTYQNIKLLCKFAK